MTGVKPSREQRLDGVALQGQFEKHGLVLQVIETVPRHGRAGLEVDQVELLGQFDVVERLEVELGYCRLAAKQFEVRLVVHADGRVGVREVRNHPMQAVQFGGQRIELNLGVLLLLAKRLPLLFPLIAFGLILGFADGFRDLVRLAVQLLGLGQFRLAALIEFDESADIDPDAPVHAVLFNEFGVFDNEFTV